MSMDDITEFIPKKSTIFHFLPSHCVEILPIKRKCCIALSCSTQKCLDLYHFNLHIIIYSEISKRKESYAF